MFPDIEGYTRTKSMWTGRTTYYRGGSGNPNADALSALFTLDTSGGRLISMIILSPLFTIFAADWGNGMLGSRGGVIFAGIGFVAGILLGYFLAQRFTQLLGAAIIGGIAWFSLYVIWCVLVQFWYADDPSYPSAKQIRQEVMGEKLNCQKVESQWNGLRIFELNRSHLDTHFVICQNAELLQLDQQLNSVFTNLDRLSKHNRENTESTLKAFRHEMYLCTNTPTQVACIRNSYQSLMAIIGSSMSSSNLGSN